MLKIWCIACLVLRVWCENDVESFSILTTLYTRIINSEHPAQGLFILTTLYKDHLF